MKIVLTLAFLAMVVGAVLIALADSTPIDRLEDDNDF